MNNTGKALTGCGWKVQIFFWGAVISILIGTFLGYALPLEAHEELMTVLPPVLDCLMGVLNITIPLLVAFGVAGIVLAIYADFKGIDLEG